jgi:hypothetical protein
VVRPAARLLGEPGHRRPEHPGGAEGVQVEILRADLQVRSGGPATVEVQREVVRGEDLAEGDLGLHAGYGAHPAVVDAEARQRAVQVAPEGVVTGAGDDRAAAPVPGGRDGDVGRRTAEELPERLDVLDPDPDLERVDVDGDPPDGDDVEGRLAHAARTSSTRTGRCSSRERVAASAT